MRVLSYAGRHEHQSRASQRWLVLVVQEVRGGGYTTGEAREGRTRREERVVGRSSSRAAVGVAEEK